MPIYEFQCESCSHCFEKLIFKGDEDFVACPVCNAPKVKKLISTPCDIGLGGGIGSSCGPSGKFS